MPSSPESVPAPSALQPVGPEAGRARLAELEARLATREQALATLKIELQRLQTRYLDKMGALYRELSEVEAAVIDAEIRAGLREPIPEESPDESASEPGGDDATHACGRPGSPSGDLRRMFRDVARAVHPDLAKDDPARYRRHSLMAEANRAYAEQDADRLRLILSAWERSGDLALEGEDLTEGARIARRIARIDARLIDIEAEFADLHRSAISRLKGRIDDARAQGWDLFAEMIQQVKRDIARGTARLASIG